ncbi:MAG: F420-dependent oxidoreductase-like protein [Acidimicrobiales bacterium]|jgi:F420-dependent oxidoreductase-like protein
MRTCIQVGADGDWQETVTYVTEAERLGVDICWVAEAWGSDAVTPLSYLAAKTETILLGAGIFQVGARSATMTAMTSMALQKVSDGRFLLGLGASGPQIIEGMHGVPFANPKSRLIDVLDVFDLAAAGEKIMIDSPTLQLPLPGGQGKAMRLSLRPPEIPIPVYIASMSPAMLELTGVRADGWMGTSFIPEGAEAAYFRHLRRGAASASRSLADIDLCQGAEVAFGNDLEAMAAARKPGLAFSLGGMGSVDTNFYNSAYGRQGYAGVAAEAQRLWVAGDRAAAADVIPDEMVLGTTLIGPADHVTARLQAWKDAGIDSIRLYPAGDTVDERLDTLGRALDLVAGLA